MWYFLGVSATLAVCAYLAKSIIFMRWIWRGYFSHTNPKERDKVAEAIIGVTMGLLWPLPLGVYGGHRRQ